MDVVEAVVIAVELSLVLTVSVYVSPAVMGNSVVPMAAEAAVAIVPASTLV